MITRRSMLGVMLARPVARRRARRPSLMTVKPIPFKFSTAQVYEIDLSRCAINA